MNQRIERGTRRAPGDTAPSDAALGIGIAKSEAAQAEVDEGEQVDVEPEAAEQDQAPAASRRATAPAAPPAEVEEIEPQLTRRSRLTTGDNDFDIPMNLRKPGWDYEFKTTRVMGADVDGYELAKVHEQGWRPVSASQMPGMMAPGSTAKTVDRMGMRLYMRPMSLTLEARAEDYQIAERQKIDKLKAASAIPIAGSAAGKMHAQVDSFEIEGVVGTTKRSAAA